MISPKFSVGGRRKGLFNHSPILKPIIDKDTLKKWVLTASGVRFTFIEDPLTGVRLESWRDSNDVETVNKSKNLWEMNLVTNIKVDKTIPKTFFTSHNVYPRASNFVQPSVIPNETPTGRSFTFVWENIKYDPINTRTTCNVIVTAKLITAKKTLEIEAEIQANNSFSSPELELGVSSIVAALHFPTIIIEKNVDEEVNNSFILSVPIAVGYTYHNPFKYLRVPRFIEESFQYSNAGERCFAAGHIGYPLSSLTKYNFGNPGGFTIPAIVIGNKQSGSGTLIYGQDQEGTNPKCFQYYADDSNLHIKTYHVSDEQMVPYGIGGYYSSSSTYSISNAPTWTLRIRPFTTNTSWVDWRGFEIYKEEAVPEQIEFGWMPDSLYNRAQQDELPSRFSELPLLLNLYGYTTGTLDTATTAIEYYRELYKNSTNPPLNYEPIIPVHYQTVHLNYEPSRSAASTYNGWYRIAGLGTGYTGVDKFQSPDWTVVNTVHANAYSGFVNNLTSLFHYNMYPFIISSGSDWTLANSGMDLVAKSPEVMDRKITNEDYRVWEQSGATAVQFSSSFTACLGVDLSKSYFSEVGKSMAEYGVSCYHDTLGAGGRGCVAESHTYYDGDRDVIATHPRAFLSNYFNKRQVEWLDSYVTAGYARYKDTYSSTTNPTADEWKITQSLEYPGDMYLKYCAFHPIYEPLGPIFNGFFNKISDPRPEAILNTIGGVTIDDLDDATIATILSATQAQHWASLIVPPNWIQKCPAFQIVHSDKCVEYEWASVFVTNAYNKFQNKGIKTGIGTYGQIQRPALKTDEQHSTEWAAFATRQWPYSNRVAAWHLDNQVGFVRPDLADIENNENVILNSGVWSGHVANLITKMLRIQSYNPDYMYHGTFKHPLEEWTTTYNTDLFETLQISKCSPPNTRPITGTIIEQQQVEHFVRKHRNSDNLLLVFGNWYSGTSPFISEFDPSVYDIGNGYQVYSLDVNSAQHGTKTLLATVSAGEVFPINLSLNEFEYAVYEIEVNTFALDPDIFSDLRTDYVPVRYSYEVTPIITENKNLAYSYGSSNTSEIEDPMVGYKSPSTQQILNNLPFWAKGRQSFDSNMWKLTNSWGMSFDNVLEQVYKSASDLNLITADTTYLSKLNYIDITSKELLTERDKKNLLFNSSFAIKDVARTNLPSGWELYGQAQDTKIDYKNSTITPCSISSESGVIKVGQQILLDNKLVNKMTASLYVLCDAPTVDVKLFISIEKTDGTSYITTGSISNRSAEWVRLVVPLDIKAQIYRVNFTVLANCSGKVSVCAPQLELESISNWSSSNIDYLPYYPFRTNFNSVFAGSLEPVSKKTPLYQIFNEQLFIDTSLPTRIEKISSPSRQLSPYTTQAFGRKVDQEGQVFRTEFSILNNNIIERSVSPSSWDIFNTYSIKDLRYYEDLRYGVKDEFNVLITPIATAIRKDLLFVLCKENYNNTEIRTIKIVRPRSTPNGEQYLESLCDFNLDLSFNKVLGLNQVSDEEVFSISFSDIDPSYMLITTTNNNKYYYKLYFDYYYFDNQNNRMYMIENYKGAKITVI